MFKNVKGRIHSIETFGAVDGPGIRYVVFLQGCALRCLYCHNPDSWDTEQGKQRDSSSIIEDILSYKKFIKKGGVTLSGGEPLLQPEFALSIIEGCKANGIHTALDTAGSVNLSLSSAVIDAVDLVILDIKALDDALCLDLTGAGAEFTLKTLNYCEKINKKVWIRHVLLPSYTLDKARLNALAKFLSGFKCIEKLELLPFHKMGEFKWQELDMEYKLYDVPAPSSEQVEEAQNIFKKYGF